MMRMLDCLVSYFGLDEEGQPTYRRYYCYHVVAGPGPAAGAGVASITAVAIHDETERCNSCQHFHVVDTGGPAAALARALRYLDAYHGGEHLRRIQSKIRGLGAEPAAEAVPRAAVAPAHAPVFQGDSTPTR